MLLGVFPNAYRNVIRMVDPKRFDADERLRTGPNTAKERRILKRRRAYLKRTLNERIAYCDTDSVVMKGD